MVKATTAKPTDAAPHLSEGRGPQKGESPPFFWEETAGKMVRQTWRTSETCWKLKVFPQSWAETGVMFPAQVIGGRSSRQPKKWGKFTQQHRVNSLHRHSATMWHHQLRILDPESFSQCEWSKSRWEMVIWVFLEIGVQNHGFSYRKPLKTPWIILKPSSSRNFQLAIASGNQPWFAGKFPCLVQWSMIVPNFFNVCWILLESLTDLLLVISSLVRQQVQCMLLLQRQRHINTHLAKRYRGFTNGTTNSKTSKVNK